MIKELKRWVAGELILRELRGLRQETTTMRQVQTRIAEALETFNRKQWPATPRHDPQMPVVEVTFANAHTTLEFMQIEIDLLRATGQPPSEEQVLEEFERRHAREGQSVLGGPS